MFYRSTNLRYYILYISVMSLPTWTGKNRCTKWPKSLYTKKDNNEDCLHPYEFCHSALLDSNFKVFIYLICCFFWSPIEKLIHLLPLVTPFEQLLNMYFGFHLDANGPWCGWISTLCKRYSNRNYSAILATLQITSYVHSRN